ncbi:MAG TPA: TetR/AcrR family transcriptional regulator [Pyrinomonadaceae bacterium]|nr:TetR/AcrR family transcriptional regulator [Pyrinomonadaceae bacterium]
MSENDRLHLVELKKKTDARVRRTRDALGDALVALMQEKPFDTITVQDVLDRAKVGRSTFYSHYSDKDDLLMSDAEEFFESVAMLLSVRGDTSDRVFPVKEFFSHITEAKQFVDALMSAGKFNDNMELARGLFARGIERRLSELPRGQGIPMDERPAIAFAHAGALLSLLTWWIDRGMRQPPSEMDQLFHKMVWKGVES